ncbi:DUF6338 family protein [Candidatus Poriferisodalis sp.]|uniref:DUF6338 family protein n=1 Tax=Candidatus Poriferisodalis sp. TaxID=3101277 RepID=UPI003B5BA5FE
MLPELETIVRTVAAAFVLLVPGAAAASGFEWHSVRYGRRGRDWVLRLLLFSGLWLGAGFALWRWLAAEYWDELIGREPVPWWLNVVPVTFVVVPYGIGWMLGWLTVRHPSRMRKVLGGNREPTAWDHVFETRQAGFVRCRLRNGRWVGGLYVKHAPVTSWAATDEADRDLYLARAILFNQDDGSPVLHDGVPFETQGGILLQRSDIES